MKRKRPFMPLAVKLEAAILQLGLNPRAVEYHHDPELEVRPFDPITNQYSPAANDAKYIRVVSVAEHANITNKDNGTGRSSKTLVAHVRRSVSEHQRHTIAMAAKVLGTPAPQDDKPRRKWATRKFNSKGRNPMRGKSAKQ